RTSCTDASRAELRRKHSPLSVKQSQFQTGHSGHPVKVNRRRRRAVRAMPVQWVKDALEMRDVVEVALGFGVEIGEQPRIPLDRAESEFRWAVKIHFRPHVR